MTTISPHRPPIVRLVNAAGQAVSRLDLDLPDLRAEALMAVARKRTGPEDFGPDHLRPGLEHLLESVERHAALHAIGRTYEHFALELSADAEQRMQLFLDPNPRDERGSHRCAPETFGIDRSGTRSTSRPTTSATAFGETHRGEATWQSECSKARRPW